MSQPAAEIVLYRDGKNVLSTRTDSLKETLLWVKDALSPFLEREDVRQRHEEYFKVVDVMDWLIGAAGVDPAIAGTVSKKAARLWQIPAVQAALQAELTRLRPSDLSAAAAATHMRLVGEQN